MVGIEQRKFDRPARNLLQGVERLIKPIRADSPLLINRSKALKEYI